ncbi:MAG: CPBP family intramembrane glutamic endopeptidase, partial [Rikenellaceae bacterium]
MSENRVVNQVEQVEIPTENRAKGDSFWRVSGVFPNIADLAIVYGLFILTQLVGQFVAYISGVSYDAAQLTSMDEELKQSAQYAYGLYSLVSYGSAMVLWLLSVVIYKYFRGDKGRLLHIAQGVNLIRVTLWGVLLTLSLSVVLSPLLEMMPKVPLYAGRGITAIISLVVVAPIFEEFICRGVILEALRRKSGVVAALILSSLFFALLHIQITLVVNAFIMGLMLGYFYIRTRSIVVPIVIHSINNALAYILLYTSNADLTLSDVIL